MMGIGGVGLPTDEEHLQGRVQNEDDGACLPHTDAVEPAETREMGILRMVWGLKWLLHAYSR